MPATKEPSVPRPKKSDPKRDDIAVKIDRKVYLMASAVASFRGQHLAAYLSKLLDPVVTKDFDNLPKERKEKP